MESDAPTESKRMADPTDELSAGRMFRRFFQILTLLFCLFLVVRTTFVEPHGVPTGSMAPTIFGNRRECPCPRCGFALVVGAPAEDARINPQLTAYCPNCGLSKLNVVPLSDEISGDRLLVDKLVFRIRSPRRWEVAVFHAPDESKIPFVKRVVGLPGEAIRIHDGDAYADGELIRKPLDAIREMKVPFFDMDHPPAPMGWSQRWVIEPLAAQKLPGANAPNPTVGIESVVRDTELHLDAGGTPQTVLGLGYRNRNLDTKLDELIRDDLGYNGLRGVPKPVHDFIAECEVEILSGSGTFTIRLGDASDTVRLDIPIGPLEQQLPAATLSHDGGTVPINYPGLRVAAGKSHRVELAFVDRRAFVLVDGKVVGAPLEVSVPQLGSTKAPDSVPPERRGTDRPLHLEARGVSVVVRHLKLSRDVQYRSEGENAIAHAHRLGADEYFLMGDNSPASEDSRAWKKPGVPEGDFIGKPFLMHQPLRIGRLVMNGNEQRFQTIDWDRFRLLR